MGRLVDCDRFIQMESFIASRLAVFGRASIVWQRVLKITYHEHLFLKVVGLLHFWAYILLMALAVVSLFSGLTQSKEYSELIWLLRLACGCRMGALGNQPLLQHGRATRADDLYFALVFHRDFCGDRRALHL